MKRNTPVIRIRRWFKKHQELTGMIVAVIFFTGMGLAGAWDIQDKENSEQLVASFGRADGSKHYSGEQGK